MSTHHLAVVLLATGFLALLVAVITLICTSSGRWAAIGGVTALLLFLTGVGTLLHANRAYEADLATALQRDFGATASAASKDRLPDWPGAATRLPVLLTADGQAYVCSVDTADGLSDLAVICDGRELPRR